MLIFQLCEFLPIRNLTRPTEFIYRVRIHQEGVGVRDEMVGKEIAGRNLGSQPEFFLTDNLRPCDHPVQVNGTGEMQLYEIKTCVDDFTQKQRIGVDVDGNRKGFVRIK